MASKTTAIPDIPDAIDPDLANFLSAVKQRLEMRDGETRDTEQRFVTEDQLIKAGVVVTGELK